MAKMCDFTDPGASPAILTKCWDVCLNRLSHYTQISTIARKCHRVLQETDKRCATTLQSRHPKPTGTATLSKTAAPTDVIEKATRCETECTQGQDVSVNDAAPFASTALRNVGAERPRNEDFRINMSSTTSNLPETTHLEQEAQFSEFLDGNFAELNSLDLMSWPNFPYLAQLETGFLDYITA